MNDGELARIIQYLRNKGWTEKEITDFLLFISSGKTE